MNPFTPLRVPGTSVYASPCAEYKCSSRPVCWVQVFMPARPCAEYKYPCQPVCWVQVLMLARVLGTSIHASLCAECYSVHASPCAEYKCSSQPGCWVQVFVSVRVLGRRFMSVHVLSTSVHTLVQGSCQPGC